MDRNVPVAGVLAAGTLTELLLGRVHSALLIGAALAAALAIAARRRAPFLSSIVVVGGSRFPSRPCPGNCRAWARRPIRGR